MSKNNVFEFKSKRAKEEPAEEPVSDYPFDYPHLEEELTDAEIWNFFTTLSKLHKVSFKPDHHLQEIKIRFTGESLEMSLEHAPLIMNDGENHWIDLFQVDKRHFGALMINDVEEDFDYVKRMCELVVKPIDPENCIIVDDEEDDD